MNRVITPLALGISFLTAASSLSAQFSITPLASFGGTDGWLQPGEIPALTSGNTERGLAYGNGNLYLVSRAGGSANIHILNPLTGAQLGMLDTTGIGGGTFPINMVAVGNDGAIYVCNLASPVSGITPFVIYRWANEGSTPTVAFSSTNITAGRMGDSFHAIGGGTSTLLVAGESNSAGSGARNGYAVMSTLDGMNYIGTLVTFPGPFPSAGDFRLGITFTDASHVFGTQGGSSPLWYTSFSGNVGTSLASPPLSSAFDRLLAYAIVDGVPLLGVCRTFFEASFL